MAGAFLAVMCPGNCSSHGVCDWATATCACSGGFTAPDCSIDASLNAPFQAVRWMLVSFQFPVFALCCWRFVVVLDAKRRKLSFKATFHDVQLQTLLALVCGSFFLSFAPLLLASPDDWITVSIGNVLSDVGLILIGIAGELCKSCCVANMCSMYLAGGLLMQFFLRLFARFHAPSKKVGTAVAWLIVFFIFTIALTLAITFSLSNSQTALTACRALIALYALLLFVIGVVYALAILRPPSDPLILRAQTEEELRSRMQIRRVMLGVLAAIVAIACLLLTASLITNTHVWPFIYAGMDVVAGLSALAACFIMGRVHSQSQTRIQPSVHVQPALLAASRARVTSDNADLPN